RGDEYLLEMPTHLQGCEVITTRAMSSVKNVKIRKFAEAHLWRFAGRQHSPNGEFSYGRYTALTQGGFLELFAAYDHPAAKTAIMRSVPWVIESQNPDGSWGEESKRDAETYAVLAGLVSVRNHLPSGFVPGR
ncbi:MAG: hypothetical protein JSV65_01505, partial [Armatimonadota bacterium]